MARTAGSVNKPQFRMITIGKLLEIFNKDNTREIPVADKFIAGFLEFEGVKGTEAYDETEPVVSTTETTTSNKEPEVDTSVVWHNPGEE
jgi:hypothetical protein